MYKITVSNETENKTNKKNIMKYDQEKSATKGAQRKNKSRRSGQSFTKSDRKSSKQELKRYCV